MYNWRTTNLLPLSLSESLCISALCTSFSLMIQIPWNAMSMMSVLTYCFEYDEILKRTLWLNMWEKTKMLFTFFLHQKPFCILPFEPICSLVSQLNVTVYERTSLLQNYATTTGNWGFCLHLLFSFGCSLLEIFMQLSIYFNWPKLIHTKTKSFFFISWLSFKTSQCTGKISKISLSIPALQNFLRQCHAVYTNMETCNIDKAVASNNL